MKIKVVREFIAFGETVPVGEADISDEVADRVIKAGWAVPGVEEWPYHIGGAYYQLSNGEKVKGKEAAVEAQAALSKTEK